MATFTVATLNDSGPGSLRAAIEAANAEPPGIANTIQFTVAGTIVLASALPDITNVTEIVAGNPATGNAPTVGIDFNGNSGLVFAAGSIGSQLVGLALGNATGHGVTLNASAITLNNNYIGLALDGTTAGNTGDGVFVAATSSGNQIGSNPDAATLAATGEPATGVVSNVISGNGGHGISLHGSNSNTIVSNRIGTSVDGNSAMANGGNGIWLTDGSSGNMIGGTVVGNDASGSPNNPTGDKGDASKVVIVAPPLGNLVSGNAGDGIRIDSSSTNNTLSGNYVGTTAGGSADLGNLGNGVAILDADFNSLLGCTVVDNPFVYYNVISGNGGNGILVTDSDHVTIRANFVGLGADNATVVGNDLDGVLINGSSRNTQVGGVIPLGNVISGNGDNGIEVAGTASGFSTLNTFGGTTAFFGAAPNGNNGVLITSTGGNQTVQTNVLSGNRNNGLEISGDAWGVTVVPNIFGLDTRGDGPIPNGGAGILITGNAHDNFVGGTDLVSNLSVIRQNTISGNDGYGVEISGAAFNNVIADSAIGTDIQELAALANGAGGVMVSSTGTGNVIGSPHIGWTPLPSPAAAANVISGNAGPGVTLSSAASFNAVINNYIGLNIFAQPLLPNDGAPIVDDGSFNLIYGNGAHGPLPWQSSTGQLEALYIGWFGRAADPAGFNRDMKGVLTQILSGDPIAEAMLAASAGFAASPEIGIYAPLAALSPPITSPTLAEIALTNSFINQTFNNLFGRNAQSSELTTWREAFFTGAASFADLVYDIASSAQDGDVLAMNTKVLAASYFTTAFATSSEPPTLAEMQAAVSAVVNETTLHTSQAATDALVDQTHMQVEYQSILSPGDITTGVRAGLDGTVILTGSKTIAGSTDTDAYLYQGPLNDTAAGTVYVLEPDFAGQSVTTATFYGPDTAIFTPGIGLGNVRAVGSYQYQENPAGAFNHGMIYEGPVDGIGGMWTEVAVPSDGVNVVGGVVIGAEVANTILHSTQGVLVVGNYDISGPGGILLGANGFIYNIATGQYTLMNINGSYDNLTSLYGIWQNGVGSDTYTIAGGTRDGTGLNVAFLQSYDVSTGAFSEPAFYTGFNQPGVITHFENITAVPGGFNLVATTDSGPAFAAVTLNPDGSFGEAVWTAIDLPGSDLLTGNIAYQNVIGGIYNTDDSSTVATYLGVVHETFVDSDGGLIMPVGSHDFVYALSVLGSFGADIVGSATAGNVLGGSIGNDTITGTQSQVHADTIYTGGGADTVFLVAGHTARTRIELFAANSLDSASDLTAGSPVSPIVASIVDANDIPQLGWWGQATGQLGGPVSDADTNAGIGTGTSQDMTTIVNFVAGTTSTPGDMVDISLDAFSDLVRAADGGNPRPGAAIFSNVVAPGGTIFGGNATVIRIDKPGGFVDAAELAADLLANPITFAGPQTAAFNHYLVAYQDTGGNVRIADMSIQRGTGPVFVDTAGGATLAISDMAKLDGVSLSSLQPSNINLLNGVEVENSTYLDFTGWRITDETNVVDAYQLDPDDVGLATTASINVALILERAQDPTALLGENWGARQQMLAELDDTDTLWTTYGADQALYDSVVVELTQTYGLNVLNGTNSALNGDYVSSAESRTIWVELDTAEQFSSLFGTTLYQNNESGNEFVFWNGNLLLPDEWNIEGLWFDTDNAPPPSNMTPGASAVLQQGSQSPGNDSSDGEDLAPQVIAGLYNFPLDGAAVATGPIGLIEPGIGSALPSSQTESFQDLLTGYLTSVGTAGTGEVRVQGANGQAYDSDDGGERSLDVGVVAATNPNSDIYLFNGSGNNGNATASVFTAIQSALWDDTLVASVLSSSFSDNQSMSPDSPFYAAYAQLKIDAALKNVTLFSALGDGGSGNETGNGLTNLAYNMTSPYTVMVGGTSLSTLTAAENDVTIDSSIVAPALAGDPETIWRLMAGGLTSLPTSIASLQTFIEVVWNQYYVDGDRITIRNSPFEGGYLVNTTTSGGVDPTQPTPDYQTAYGLAPVTSDPLAETGRGAPDVSANAGGNLSYLTPNADMVGSGPDGGTSAATPLWASLGVQLNTIFADQGLPNLGYMNDLLYIASAIAPASFNDITVGNNTSSFTLGGSYRSNGTELTPTGFGYYAGPGYDLTTGLGTPDGVLLARALTAIAHAQVSYAGSPDLLDAAGSGWTSGASQTLLFQTMSAGGALIGLDLGGDPFAFSSGATDTYAWTSRLAQQSLQADFDPALVRMFDKYGQGAVVQASVSAGESIAVSINASGADAIQGTLSSPFGFADFVAGSGAVRVARAVTVAETVDGLDDQTAVVRLRQNGEDTLSLSLYRVDDFDGSIGGLQPGDAGYAAAAQARLYELVGGGTAISGPGYGNYTQAELANVDSGDLVAMMLVNQTAGATFWPFAQANESVGGQQVGHLWSYGLNTFGWEDLIGGGDRDYNDLLVQLDFTSTYGSGWLV